MSVTQVTEDGFVRDGGRFTPWGANYFVPGTGWPPQLWRRFEPGRAGEDFARMRDLGVNVMRVFATWMSFVESESRVNEEGFERFDQMLEIAWENGIMLHPTGPDHWEGFPAFTEGQTNYITSEILLKAAENYWRELSRRYKDDERIFAFDLLNEPSVRPDERFWVEWRKIAEPHNDPIEWPLTVYRRPEGMCDQAMIEMERLRNRLGDAWLRRMTDAIRSSGTRVPVTCGFLQSTFPFTPHTCGFHLSGAADMLDFISIHFYPGTIGRSTDYRWELDRGALWASYAASFGKPVVLAEFGWVGGNSRPLAPGGFVVCPPSTEGQSAVWCRDLVMATRPFACGWLCWGAYDMPEASDCSRYSGLMAPDGRAKEWGQMFWALGPRLAGTTPASGLPVRTFDPLSLLTGRADHYDEVDQLIFQRRVEGDFGLVEEQP